MGSRTALVEDLMERFPQVPREAVFKEDLLRGGVAFGHEFDDALFTFTWDTGSILPICMHACLRYNRVASLTRLIPPVIPKRRNNRLKCALTVRRAPGFMVAIIQSGRGTGPMTPRQPVM